MCGITQTDNQENHKVEDLRLQDNKRASLVSKFDFKRLSSAKIFDENKVFSQITLRNCLVSIFLNLFF